MIALSLCGIPKLVQDDTNPDPTEAGAPEAAASARSIRGRIIALAVLAFLLMLAEGTADDWSALQAVENLNASESAGSIGYGTFAVAMTIGQFAANPVSHKLGVVRYGSACRDASSTPQTRAAKR